MPSPRPGVRVLYLAPLKALINDQHDRLSALRERLDIPVHRWHGDVPGSKKSAVLKRPGGILLITPESLEALFVTRGPAVAGLLAGLEYVVVDELHAFLGTERGAQLRSLLHRTELALRRRVPRIGLSATLGDMGLAATALRPGRGALTGGKTARRGDGKTVRLWRRDARSRRCAYQPPARPGPQVWVRESWEGGLVPRCAGGSWEGSDQGDWQPSADRAALAQIRNRVRSAVAHAQSGMTGCFRRPC